MKRISALLLAASLVISLSACSSGDAQGTSGNLIETVAPLVTQSVAPIQTVSPASSATADATTSAAPSDNPAQSTATPEPSASATPAPQMTSAVGDATGIGGNVDVEVISGFTNMVANSAYIVVGTISEDVGVVDILAGTKTRELAPNAYIGNWQYAMEVTQVLKTDSSAKISKGSTITVSLPYEYCMNVKTKPMEKEDSYVALTKGNSYVLFLDYDSELKFYIPAGFEPNKFSLSGSTMYILTGKEGLDIAWEAGAGKTGVSLASLEKACK